MSIKNVRVVVLGLTKCEYDSTMRLRPAGRYTHYPRRGYVLLSCRGYVGGMFCSIQRGTFVAYSFFVWKSKKNKKIGRDCIANAMGPQCPLRTRTLGIFLLKYRWEFPALWYRQAKHTRLKHTRWGNPPRTPAPVYSICHIGNTPVVCFRCLHS